MADAYIFDHVRTPRGKGKKDGSLHEATPVQLASQMLRALPARNPGLDTKQIEDVILGCVMPVGEQGADIARTAVLMSGYDESVPGVQVNRFCASALEAVNMAAAKVMSGLTPMAVGGWRRVDEPRADGRRRRRLGHRSGRGHPDLFRAAGHQRRPDRNQIRLQPRRLRRLFGGKP